MIDKKSQTLVRVGRYDNPLEEAVKRFSEPLQPALMGLGNIVKYATFKEGADPYLLIVSQQKYSLMTTTSYNTILSVTSYSEKMNQDIAKKFEDETGMNLNMYVPEPLRIIFAMMDLSFKAFEKNPKAAMAYLTGMSMN